MNTDVFITDPVDHGLDAEQQCMLSSLRSRSTKSNRELLKQVKEKGSADFMKQYYLGYGSKGVPGTLPGHGSICQSGSTTVELEGISMLSALAFEDHPLFNGQESSTRYIDFSDPQYVVPKVIDKDLPAAHQIISKWFELYRIVYDGYYAKLLEENEKPDDLDQKTFNRALRAAAFDKASGFLPAATKTNVSWHTQLDNANTQIHNLQQHPMSETRDLAHSAQKAMAKRYPNSVKQALPEGHAEYLRKYSTQIHYSEISMQLAYAQDSDFAIGQKAEDVVTWSLDKDQAKETYSSNILVSENTEELLMNLPKYMYAPSTLKGMGYIQLHGCLDLASFRDLHRHRDGNIPIPYLANKFGMHSWYMKDMPDDVNLKLALEVPKLFEMIAEVQHRNPYEGQLLLPLGLRVPVELNWQIPQLMYVCNLRSGHACREPLRRFVQNIGMLFDRLFVNAETNFNYEPGKPYYYERGNQTIMKVNADGTQEDISENVKEEPTSEVELGDKKDDTEFFV